MNVALQRSYFRNTTRENQETERAHSRTEDDNKQVAAKNKKKCLKRYPKNDVERKEGEWNPRRKKLPEGRKKGNQLDALK